MFTSGYNACSDKIKSANEACKSAFDNIPSNPVSGRRKRKRDIEDITEGRPEHEHFFASLKTYKDDHNYRAKPTRDLSGTLTGRRNQLDVSLDEDELTRIVDWYINGEHGTDETDRGKYIHNIMQGWKGKESNHNYDSSPAHRYNRKP